MHHYDSITFGTVKIRVKKIHCFRIESICTKTYAFLIKFGSMKNTGSRTKFMGRVTKTTHKKASLATYTFTRAKICVTVIGSQDRILLVIKRLILTEIRTTENFWFLL